MRRAFALACLSLLGSAPAQAGLTLNGGWQQQRDRELDLPAAGYGVGMSLDLGACCYFGLNYSALRTDSFEDAATGDRGRLEYRAGGPEFGVAWPWLDTLGVTLAGGYTEASTRGLGDFRDDLIDRAEGPTGSATLWFLPTRRFTLSAGRAYSYLLGQAGWDTTAGAGLRLWRELWLDGGYWRGSGIDGWTVGLRTSIDDR